MSLLPAATNSNFPSLALTSVKILTFRSQNQSIGPFRVMVNTCVKYSRSLRSAALNIVFVCFIYTNELKKKVYKYYVVVKLSHHKVPTNGVSVALTRSL